MAVFPLKYQSIIQRKNYEIPKRGPVVIIGQGESKGPAVKTNRKIQRHYVLFNQKMGSGEKRVYGRQSFSKLVSDDSIAKSIRSDVEAGYCIQIQAADMECLEFLCKLLLDIEITNDCMLGISIYSLKVELSDLNSVRQEAYVEMLELENWQDRVDSYQDNADSSLLALTHSIYRNIQNGLSGNHLDFYRLKLLTEIEKIYTIGKKNNNQPEQLNQLQQKVMPTLESQSDEDIEKNSYDAQFILHMMKNLKLTEKVKINREQIKRDVTLNVVGFLVLAPVVLWSLCQHYIPNKMNQWIVFWTGRQFLTSASEQMIVQVLSYLLQTWFIGSMLNWQSSSVAIYLLSLPLSGWLSLVAIESRHRVWANFRLLRLINQQRDLQSTMLQMRWNFLENVGLSSE